VNIYSAPEPSAPLKLTLRAQAPYTFTS
jgi:hypothetical protein